jgi:hypothetical protein
MRVLILAAAATLVVAGTAQAAQHHHPRHQHAINAPAAEGSAPADTLSAHDLYIRNLRDSGYNPAADNVAN